MKVLGIDPGLSITGYGIIEKASQKTSIIDYGAVRFSSSHPLEQRLGSFYEIFNEKIKAEQITLIALETPFLGKNAQNFLKLGYLRGVMYLLAHQHHIKIVEFSPSQVKRAITGSGSAQKEQVARAITRLFPSIQPSSIVTFDVSDALAVTLCGAWHETQPIRTASKRTLRSTL